LRYEKAWDAMLMKDNRVVQSDALAETRHEPRAQLCGIEDSEEYHALHQPETLFPCSKYFIILHKIELSFYIFPLISSETASVARATRSSFF
jgi:hypothetical protein